MGEEVKVYCCSGFPVKPRFQYFLRIKKFTAVQDFRRGPDSYTLLFWGETREMGAMMIKGGNIFGHSPLTLAYVGDAVYELYVREHIAANSQAGVKTLNKMALSYVTAAAQSSFVESLLDKLTEEEQSVYRRGRNANPHTVPKRAAVADYRRATGLEAVFGFLFLSGRTERLNELFLIIVECVNIQP